MRRLKVLTNHHLRETPYPQAYYDDLTQINLTGAIEAHQSLVDLIATARSLRFVILDNTVIEYPTPFIVGLTKTRTVRYLSIQNCSAAAAFVKALPAMSSLDTLKCRSNSELPLAIAKRGFIRSLVLTDDNVVALRQSNFVELVGHNLSGLTGLVKSNQYIRHLTVVRLDGDPLDVLNAVPESLHSITFRQLTFSPEMLLPCVPMIRARKSQLHLKLKISDNTGPAWNCFRAALAGNPHIDPVIKVKFKTLSALKKKNYARRCRMRKEIATWLLINAQERLVCKDVERLICSFIATAENPKGIERLLKRRKVGPDQ